MALSLRLPNDSLVLKAYASLIGAAPGSTAFGEHKAFIAANGQNAYVSALNSLFASVSNADLASAIRTNLGLTSIVDQATTEAFLAANAANRVGAIFAVADVLATTSEASLAAAKAAYNTGIDASYNYSVVATNYAGTSIAALTAVSTTFELTSGVDKLTGTSGADLFNAFILDNGNTLQSGDVINGGTGVDTLFAEIGNSAKFAISATTTGVETIKLQAQATPVDATNGNNTSGSGNVGDNKTVETHNTVQIDAQKMAGVSTWHDSNSRADLIIEDVRIADGAKTKDVTIIMESTDAGNVDFGVYFDQHSLRNTSSGTSSLNVFVMDVASVQAGTAALKDVNFGAYSFYADNVLVTLTSQSINDAQTYAELKTAFETALKTANVGGVTTDLSGQVTVTLSEPVNFTTAAAAANTSASVAANFQNQIGQIVQFSVPASMSISNTSTGKPDAGWIASGTAPSTGAIVQTYNAGTSSSAELVTSTIVLDDVGRGSTGGDLVVGGMSVGVTSTSKGVERFEIEVRDNSKLQTINSTNDALREVTIKNGLTTNTAQNSGVYSTTVTNAGNLTVNGNANSINNGIDGDVAVGEDSDAPLAGLDALHHNNAYGFTDVRLIDGSAMTGKLEFKAQITEASIAKYVNTMDVQGNPTADVAGSGNVNYGILGANFIYSGGSNADTMVVAIDGQTLASKTNSGYADFTFTANGGAGNDTITVDLGALAANNESAAWYADQKQNKNLTINGGDGDDVITKTGSGDAIIDLGAGNDTVYADNSGTKGPTWLVSSVNTAGNDLEGSTTGTGNSFLYNGKLTVSFSGASGTGNAGGVTGQTGASGEADATKANFENGFEVEVSIPTGANYTVNQFYINQAIKSAINGNAVLSKLLKVTDAPANTLKITSLTDGLYTENDLKITVSAPDLTGLTTSEQTTALSAYKLFAQHSSATITNANTAQTDSVTAKNLVRGMDVNQVVEGGSALTFTLGTITQGAAAVKEVFTVTFAGDTDHADNGSIAFNGTTINLVNGDDTAAEIATKVAAGVYADWDVTYTAASSSVTFTQKVGGVISDVGASDFTLIDVTFAAPLDFQTTTQGVAATKESVVVTIGGSVTAGEVITIDTVDSADLTGLSLTDAATAVATAANDAGGVWSASATGTAITFTATTAGVTTDLSANDFVSSVAGNLGALSTATSDNKITVGAGNDVVVLGTGALSNDTVVFAGVAQGTDSIVNFTTGTGGNADLLDFSAYLTGKTSLSGSTASEKAIGVELNPGDVAANSVTILTGTFTTTDTFAGLTAEKLLAAINKSNTGAANYAGIQETTLDADNSYITTAGANNLVGGVGKAVVLVENNLNQGEYAMFELTFSGLAANTNKDFTSAQLIGVADFGDTLAGVVYQNLVGGIAS